MAFQAGLLALFFFPLQTQPTKYGSDSFSFFTLHCFDFYFSIFGHFFSLCAPAHNLLIFLSLSSLSLKLSLSVLIISVFWQKKYFASSHISYTRLDYVHLKNHYAS